VEDYFHVEAFKDSVAREDWGSYSLRVEDNTRRILDLLERQGVHGTFFVLGWVARRAPRLVAELVSRGHEVACHSNEHRLVHTQSPEEFREDLREATSILEDSCGVRPRGYRAPSFSITRDSLWALEILAEEGYEYDSSIFPIRHDIYGFPGFPRHPVRIVIRKPAPEQKGPQRRGDGIVEFPPSTFRLLGGTFPGPGGGYLRIYPRFLARWALRRMARAEGRPIQLYVHPWEIDPDQPRIPCRLRSRFRHYVNLARTEAKLEEILSAYPFAPMGQVIESLSPLEEHKLASLG
jgi:polysaccharide deacetylase family protein (PEP-CTERM system associated)